MTPLLLVAFAFAAPAPSSPGLLWVEQARVALLHDRPDLARAYSMKALSIDPEEWGAWRLYLRGSAEAGLQEVAEAELAALDDPGAKVALAWWMVSSRQAPVASLLELEDPRAKVAFGWSILARGREAEVLQLKLPPGPLTAKLRLRALAMVGDSRTLNHEAQEWLRKHPESPDVLQELWGPRVPDTRAQKEVLKVLRSRVVAGEQDPAWLILAARTFVAAKDREIAAEVARRVDAQGLMAPLNRKPWGPSMRREMGKALVGQDPFVMPEGSWAERTDLATTIAAEWLVRDRADEALALWEQLERDVGGWQVARGLAVAREANNDEVGARAARTDALLDVLGHWPVDPCGLNLTQRAVATGEILADALAAGHEISADAEPVIEALFGDLEGWRTQLSQRSDLASAELDWCLSAALGSPRGSGWTGPAPEVAATMMPRLHASALGLLPEELRPAKKRSGIPEPGDRFPDVVLPVESGAVSLHEFAASSPGLTVVSLWATWCAPCQKELPLVDALIGRLRTEGLEVDAVAVSVDEDERAYRRHLQRKPLANLLVGRSPDILGAVGGAALPVTWVIDDDARVVLVHVGYDPQLPARIEASVRGE
jgi:thiol-disulfide isomerase/thioredoxin